MDEIDQFIRKEWPFASIIFRPMMTARQTLGVFYFANAINNSMRLYLSTWRGLRGGSLWYFEEDGGLVGPCEIDYLRYTIVGEEMTALEEEVDEYITAGITPSREVAALMSHVPDFCSCFDITYVRGTVVRIRSHGRSVMKDVLEIHKDLIAAEKLIARRRAYLTSLRLIRELPQPIAEEVEEQFEPFEV